MEDDLFKSSPYRLGEPLNKGRLLHDTLTTSEHYSDALRAIDTLEHKDLAHLALYVAANAVATRSKERNDGTYGAPGGKGSTAATPTWRAPPACC